MLRANGGGAAAAKEWLRNHRLVRALGLGAFAFFLVKGLAWVAVLALVGIKACGA